MVVQSVWRIEHQEVNDNTLSQIKEFASSSCNSQDKNPKEANSRNKYERDPPCKIWNNNVSNTVIVLV
jgi:hypothetical protein